MEVQLIHVYFIRFENDCKTLVAFHVDDGLIDATNRGMICDFLAKLKILFEITTEPVGYFLVYIYSDLLVVLFLLISIGIL